MKKSCPLPCARLDRFITAKAKELAQLMVNQASSEGVSKALSKRHQEKVVRLRRALANAKAELQHLETGLRDRLSIKRRLEYLEAEYRKYSEQLCQGGRGEKKAEEPQRWLSHLQQRISVLTKKLCETEVDS